MPFEIRAVEPGEVDDLLTADRLGFGGEPPRPGASRSWTTAELDRTRAGMVTRPDFWWPQVFWEFMFGRTKAGFVAVHADSQGRDDGYVVYDIAGDWIGGLPDRRLLVIDIQAESPATWISLWRYVFG